MIYLFLGISGCSSTTQHINTHQACSASISVEFEYSANLTASLKRYFTDTNEVCIQYVSSVNVKSTDWSPRTSIDAVISTYCGKYDKPSSELSDDYQQWIPTTLHSIDTIHFANGTSSQVLNFK